MKIILKCEQKTGLDGRFHYVYKIVNEVNGRYYIGKHSSTSVETDGYIGSGKILNQSYEKYGKESFHKEILSFHDTSHDAYEMERFIIGDDIDPMSYNLKLGGLGGFCKCKECEAARMAGYTEYLDSDHHRLHMEKLVKLHTGRKRSDETRANISKNLVGTTKDEEARKKMSAAKLGIPQKIVTCPKCGKSGGITGMHQYHFDNCGKKKTKTISKVKCPHCDVIGNANTMKRWHFDNCKHKV